MLLALDTSTAQIGIALYDGEQVIGEMLWRGPQRHTVELAPALSGLLNRCGVTMDMINALGIAIGPGSFTSLRVGLALAKGIAFARHIPLIGIHTLDIVAHAQPASKNPMAVVLQAGRNKLAVGWYKTVKNVWHAQGDAQVMTVDALADSIEKPTIVCGELTGEERGRLARKRVNVALASPAQSVRRPSALAELAYARFRENQFDDAASLAPIYLHTA